MQPELIHLSNGIPVVLQNYDGHVAATYWWVRIGSADEAPQEAGFAHFLEHMLFKDAAAKETGKASTGQMAQAIESLGGEINAYTSFDQTVYHVTCAEHHWEKVIDAFGTMAKPQRFLRDDFEREREVILEELRKNEDSPGRQLFQGLLTETFSKHPYGRPVIGYVKTLKAARVAKLESFYLRSYTPENMGLILVGPVKDLKGARKKSVLKLLEKRFGAKVLKKRGGKRYTRPMDAPMRKSAAFVQKSFDVKTPTLALSFRAPDLKHPDVPALDVASSVLAMGELSRLYQRLFYKSSVATDVSGGLFVPNDPGLLYFQAELVDTGKIESASEEIFEEFKRLRDEGPTPEELERVIVNAESERLYSTQTADGIAGRLGFLKFGLGDLDFDRKYLDDLRAVDRQKVREVAGSYLDLRRMSGALLMPKSEGKFDFKSIQQKAERVLAVGDKKKAGAIQAKAPALVGLAASSEPLIRTLSSGARVAYRPRPDSHVMSIHAATLGGLRLEIAHPVESAEKDWGSSYMMSLTWTKGTKKRAGREISALIEGRAAGMDGFSGRNTIGAQVTGLARDWDVLSDLYSEVLLEPSFPDEEVDHSRRVAIDSVQGIDDHTSQLCSKLFLETLFEKHPYGKMTLGSIESLNAVSSSKLIEFHRRWLNPEKLVLSVVGNVKEEAFERWCTAIDARLKGLYGARAGARPSFTVPEEPELKAPRWVEKNLGREQNHILVGGLGIRIDSEERFAVRLMQTLLGGQSGRLFIELREKKSLAYTVAPVSFEGMERGYLGTYIACSPQKTKEALKGIQVVLEQLASKGPQASEMKRAKEFFLGRRAMELQSDSSLATHYGLKMVYGMPLTEDAEIYRRIESVTPKQIQEVCRKFLVEPHQVTAVVG